MKKLRAWIAENELLAVAILLLAIALVLGVWGHVQDYGTFKLGELLHDFYANTSSELFSIVITVVIIDRLAQRRQKREEEATIKERLIRELGSQAHDIAITAAEELDSRGWLCDGTLHLANLRKANLQGADLQGADLYGACFFNANLHKALLWDADLQRTNMQVALLQEARLEHANLQRADLAHARLQGANLRGANLEGANLRKAHIDDSQFGFAKFNEDTILPDGTSWTPETDISRFTDPSHDDFWTADVVGSPRFHLLATPEELDRIAANANMG